MQKYRCHKVVEAAQIVGYDNGGTSSKSYGVYVGVRHEWIETPLSFFARGEPAKGDYLVRYEPTPEHPKGYLSWSPKAVFEAGYTLIEQQERRGDIGHAEA